MGVGVEIGRINTRPQRASPPASRSSQLGDRRRRRERQRQRGHPREKQDQEGRKGEAGQRQDQGRQVTKKVAAQATGPPIRSSARARRTWRRRRCRRVRPAHRSGVPGRQVHRELLRAMTAGSSWRDDRAIRERRLRVGQSADGSGRNRAAIAGWGGRRPERPHCYRGRCQASEGTSISGAGVTNWLHAWPSCSSISGGWSTRWRSVTTSGWRCSSSGPPRCRTRMPSWRKSSASCASRRPLPPEPALPAERHTPAVPLLLAVRPAAAATGRPRRDRRSVARDGRARARSVLGPTGASAEAPSHVVTRP